MVCCTVLGVGVLTDLLQSATDLQFDTAGCQPPAHRCPLRLKPGCCCRSCSFPRPRSSAATSPTPAAYGALPCMQSGNNDACRCRESVGRRQQVCGQCASVGAAVVSSGRGGEQQAAGGTGAAEAAAGGSCGSQGGCRHSLGPRIRPALSAATMPRWDCCCTTSRCTGRRHGPNCATCAPDAAVRRGTA